MESQRFFAVVSPSLLENVTIKPTSSRFSLGMEEFIDEYMNTMEANFHRGDNKLGALRDNASTSLSSLRPLATSQHTRQNATIEPHPRELETPPKKQRVHFQKLSDAEIQVLAKPMVPKNTQTSTKWALDNFHAWLSHQNSTSECDLDKCPETLLDDMDPAQLNKWLGILHS